MNSEKISVIIPVYNGKATLEACLSSVLSQTYNNYEVIVVDNNSTDKTKEIIKKLEQKDKRLKYIFEGKSGRGVARNAGLKQAQGGIIAMTDVDCVVPQDWIKKLTQPICDGYEQAIMGFEEDSVNNYWTRNIQKANWEFIQRNLDGEYINHLDTKNFAIRTSLMKKLMLDSKISNMEDFDLFLRLRKVSKIRFIPSIIVKHNHRNSFIETVRTNFDRGYWVKKILKKHKFSRLKSHPMTESISVGNFICFPLWIILQFIKKPIGEAYFLLVSEFSWRIGILSGLTEKGDSDSF